MIYLVDTRVLIWLAVESQRLNQDARDLLAAPDNLVAQANVEGMTLITVDEQIAFYPGPILKI